MFNQQSHHLELTWDILVLIGIAYLGISIPLVPIVIIVIMTINTMLAKLDMHQVINSAEDYCKIEIALINIEKLLSMPS